MPERRAVAYRYDGSFDGLLCCVFEGYTRREQPAAILCREEPQTLLYPEFTVPTVAEHAARVFASLSRKMGPLAQHLIQQAFLWDHPQRELAIYRFIQLGYRVGPRVTGMLADETVCTIAKAVQAVENESHYFREFLRFDECSGSLFACIEPKHLVLPNLAEHFCGRFPEERFLIHDKAHRMALIYQPYRAQILALEQLEPPAPSTPDPYRSLWAGYYNAVGVEQRYNPKCRMTHMPKRFWKHLTEFEQAGKPLPPPVKGCPLPEGGPLAHLQPPPAP